MSNMDPKNRKSGSRRPCRSTSEVAGSGRQRTWIADKVGNELKGHGPVIASPRIELPPYAQVVRGLALGVHPYLRILPSVLESPAIVRILRNGAHAASFVVQARVRVNSEPGYAYVDVEAREIVLAERYYATGSSLDLYLDLLHELTHLRQLYEGLDVWDESLPYPSRPTEVEAYAVAVEEGRRLGMDEAALIEHVTNPCLSDSDVKEIYANVLLFLDRSA